MHLFPPSRAAGLARLHDFIPQMGRAYAIGRNTDPGPNARQSVSMLSPYLRRRLVTETEVIAAAHTAHGEAAEKFIAEVAWRSYFKGFLEQHPSIWAAYLQGVSAAENRLATEGGLRRMHHDACLGQTGIDGFDAWAQELAATGWLHNHARMWFASIWIFTLRLPWELGAAFFLRHLHDGDPASNTLSWRWVGGLHTRGKHYVARAENIVRYTEGRFDPRGQLDEAPSPLDEARAHPRTALASADPLPAGPYAMLLHDEDLHPEHAAGATIRAIVASDPVGAFTEAAIADTIARFGPMTRLAPDAVAEWVATQSLPVVTPWAPIGPTATLLANLKLRRLRRDWDSAVWPHATKGFFQLRQRLPDLVATIA